MSTKQSKKWHCDACNADHLSKTHQNATADGKQYCDKWEPVTTESLEADIEAYLKAMSNA